MDFFFNTNKKKGRLDYLYTNIFTGLVVFIYFLFNNTFTDILNLILFESGLFMYKLIIDIIINSFFKGIYFFLMTILIINILQRLNDLKLAHKYAFLILVPFVNIIFFFYLLFKKSKSIDLDLSKE